MTAAPGIKQPEGNPPRGLSKNSGRAAEAEQRRVSKSGSDFLAEQSPHCQRCVFNQSFCCGDHIDHQRHRNAAKVERVKSGRNKSEWINGNGRQEVLKGRNRRYPVKDGSNSTGVYVIAAVLDIAGTLLYGLVIMRGYTA